jgi:amidase
LAKHVFAPTRFHNVIGTAEPVLAVADGDTIVASTLDAAGFDGQGVQCAKGPNPMTGPFFVEGAEPGDALEVRIDRMTAQSRRGLDLHACSGQRRRTRCRGETAAA